MQIVKIGQSWLKLVSLVALLIVLVQPVQAIVKPEENSNNIFGIHLAVPDSADLQSTAKLVNSNEGDWGYVTVVIQENDRDTGKWQDIFNQMRRLHLIPLVRLATSPQGEVWRAPEPSDSDTWVEFLNSLNWVVKNRYIILFNEANHAAEWGGAVDPESYRAVALAFAKKLKQANSDYFIMLAGLDQSAPQSPPVYMDEAVYLQTMFTGQNMRKWTKLIDGLSSHSYPNPGFMGSPFALGRTSVRGYEWELAYLKSLGLSKELPVFITETGWQRVDEQITASNFESAFLYAWLNDPRVVAVTPFVLNYQAEPFLGFSWQKAGSSEFYEQYRRVEQMLKVKGNPSQKTSFFMDNSLPTELVQDSNFIFKLSLQNLGQSIWDKADNYSLNLISAEQFLVSFSEFAAIEPDQVGEIDFYLKTPEKVGKHKTRLGIFKNNRLVSNLYNWSITIVPNVDIELNYSLLLNLKNIGDDFKVEIYDQNERLVYLKRHIFGSKGKIVLKKVKNIAIGERYRIVLLKPYYLPRQTYLKINKQNNLAKLKLLLPLDWNKDGQWTGADLLPWLKGN